MSELLYKIYVASIDRPCSIDSIRTCGIYYKLHTYDQKLIRCFETTTNTTWWLVYICPSSARFHSSITPELYPGSYVMIMIRFICCDSPHGTYGTTSTMRLTSIVCATRYIISHKLPHQRLNRYFSICFMNCKSSTHPKNTTRNSTPDPVSDNIGRYSVRMPIEAYNFTSIFSTIQDTD